ncbi:unnamed protein product [Ranitomeya imitator]|uniref:Tc1-like transposase DDE domain-containing protein n=1 Tax=Ranitomeya imitator TaxID=111125 RepID=A0ABN9LUW1_9NEOB|nr:unnamed protein product [Ranitomeya imitator]
MGQKRDLTGSEKSKIVRCLAEGGSSLEIAKLLKRDHRTIKRFMANSQQGRKKRVGQKRHKITAHELRKIKREAAKMPFVTSFAIFQSCNITGVTKSTRCAILRDMAKVLWTDEMTVILDLPDGWARGRISKGQRAPLRLRRQQGGGGVLVWAGFNKDELVGPFQVEDGVKLNSQTYCQFLEDNFFKQWYRKTSVSFKKNMIFMQDNTPSHASNYSTAWLASKGLKEEKIMTWPPCSPDLNPIENLWSLIKSEIYREGKQSTSRNSVWEAVMAAESMDGWWLLSVIIKKGYIGGLSTTFQNAVDKPLMALDSETEALRLFQEYATKMRPFYESSRHGLRLDTVQLLTDCLRGHPNWSLAHVAVELGLRESFKHNGILRSVNSTECDDGCTPLHLACKKGDIECIQELVEECQAREDIADVNGETVYHYAARQNNPRVIEILCSVPSVGINHLSNTGETPLHVACRMGKTESVLAFLRSHARCDILGKDGYAIHTAMKYSMKG